MDSVKHEEVTIIDQDDTSSKVCHVVDGFLLEESNEPFPVSFINYVHKICLYIVCLDFILCPCVCSFVCEYGNI